MQTFLVKRVINSLEGSIDGKINIEKIYIIFFNKIILKNVSIVSNSGTPHLDSLKQNFNHCDTLVSCKKISIGLSPLELAKLQIKLTSVNLQDGVFNLQNESGKTTNLSRIFKLDAPKKEKDTTQSTPLNLIAHSLKIQNFRFTLNNPDKYIDNGDSIINFADLDLRNIYININNIRLERDTIFAKINNISAIDKSGFTLQNLNCNLEVSGKETRFNNLILADNYSRITANYFSMKYNSTKDFAEFTDNVVLGIDFADTYLNFKTIGRIAPTIYNSSLAFFLTGEASGPVSNIRAQSLKVTSESGATFLDLKARLNGLPDIKETMVVAEIENCYTTSNDVANIISSFNNTPFIPFFKKLPPFIRYNFRGDFTGLLNDFVADGELSSPLGKIDIDVLLKAGDKKQGVFLKGDVHTDNLNLGRVLSNKTLGKVTMHSNVTALIRGEREGGTEISIDSIKISKLGVNGYDYSNIYAIGKYTSNDFDGRIICHDPNLDFIFQGLFSFTKKENSKYDFYLDLPYANLAAMNIDRRDSISEVNARVLANFIQTPDNDIIGTIDIKNSGYINSKGSFNFGSIKLNAHQTDNSFNTKLVSPFIKATFDGSSSLATFTKKLLTIILYDKYNNYFGKSDIDEVLNQKDDYNLFVQTYDTKGICEFVLPGLYIKDSTTLKATIDIDNKLDFSLKSGRIAIKDSFLKDLELCVNNDSSSVNIDLFSKDIKVAGLNMDSLYINMNGGNNILNMTLNVKSDTIQNNRAKINTSLEFINDTIIKKKSEEINRIIKLNIKESEIALKGEHWKFAPANIIMADSTYNFNEIKLYNGEQDIIVNGFMSAQNRDSLSVSLNKFDLGMFNLFLKENFNFMGYLSGKVDYSTLDGSKKLFLDLNGDSVYVAKTPVGKMRILSKWDHIDKNFKLFVNSRFNDKTNLNVIGFYKPENSYINVDASLNELSVAYFEPFLADIISNSNGTISGDFNLSGPLNKLNLSGKNCILNKYNFTINFTQVPYTINGPIDVNLDGIYLNNTPITDQYGSVGKVNGGLYYKNFKDITLNTNVSFENFQCLNTKEKDNDAFYGSTFATGSLNIKGPLNKIILDANISSNPKTYIHIPLSNAATANQTNLLTFVTPKVLQKVDPYDELISAKYAKVKQPTELDVRLKANMNPQAEIAIEINKSVGDIIKVNGSGLINMNINPNKEIFDIFGDYTISQGSYKFVLMGFASKDFLIQPGGTINFNGAITNTTLNLTAIYRTKASINTLIADTSSVSARRTVNCEIGMSGQLTNPELTFNISIPDLDPTTKVRVESALNTTGKIQKQFMALIVSGGFIPDEQSGIANNSTILYSNASEILSNQLNNVLQQLGIPLDLGLNYQPGTKGNDIFDVAVSTQLFNNRVLINGNIGNDPYANTNKSDVIGNLDVEIKLDKNGRLRLDIFSHAADKYSNYLDDKQRSGIGFGYQQEFNTFKELFRRKTKEEKEYLKEKKKRDKEYKIREKELEKQNKIQQNSNKQIPPKE